MIDPHAVARRLVAHALETHAQDVCLIIVYGSRATGTDEPGSDLDICYLPEEGKAQELSSQFVLDGLPYDFWPLQWSQAEAIANARSSRPWVFSASLIAGARVLHYRSQADLGRFQALQGRIRRLTQPESRPYMQERAVEQFDLVLREFGRLHLAVGDLWSAYAAGRRLYGAAVNCLALLNQAYFNGGLAKCLPWVLGLPRVPPDLGTCLEGLAVPGNTEALLRHARTLVSGVEETLRLSELEPARPLSAREAFADYYPCVVEYVAKIIAACGRADAVAAGASAYILQDELMQICGQMCREITAAETSLPGDLRESYESLGLPDLLKPASEGDLCALRARTLELQATLAGWLEAHGVALNVMADEAGLGRFLAKRKRAGR